MPDVTGLDKTFDYLVPEDLADRVAVGSMVRVPLHGRRVGGWVTQVGGEADVPAERLVPIARWSGIGPDADLVDLAGWAAHRWGAARLRPLLVAASPPTLVRALPADRRRARPRVASSLDALLRDGGGVLRTTPADDPAAAVRAVVDAVGAGPVVVVHPAHTAAAHIAAALRADGRSVALLPDGWAAAAGGVDVVVGTRSSVWARHPRAAAYVVLDEHDDALQEERTPTWHARDVAIERARREGAPCLLVSPCPSVAALAWSGRRWMRPRAADERAGWPVVHVVDRTDEEPWRRSLLTSPLIAALRDPAQRVVCVHNAPGRARLLACRSCRNVLACERCDAAVRQADDGTLVCARCATTRPPVCDRCGSSALANVRPGITRLREELEAAAGRPVVSVAASGTADLGPDSLEGASVLVGTEAVLHRVDHADVVAFLDLDAELLAPRYRAAEQAMTLVVRAARLLGPRDRGGRLLVQTTRPDHEVIAAAVHADPGRLARVEAARRRDLGLPPFGALAAVSGPDAAGFVAATGLASARDGDTFLLRAGGWEDLADGLARAPRPRGGRLRVEVDPPRR